MKNNLFLINFFGETQSKITMTMTRVVCIGVVSTSALIVLNVSEGL